MTDINCTDGSTNVLIKAPTLTEGLPMKLSLADSFNKCPAFSLFKSGMSVNTLLRFDFKSKNRVAELGTKPNIPDVRLSFACKEGGYFVRLGCKF